MRSLRSMTIIGTGVCALFVAFLAHWGDRSLSGVRARDEAVRRAESLFKIFQSLANDRKDLEQAAAILERGVVEPGILIRVTKNPVPTAPTSKATASRVDHTADTVDAFFAVGNGQQGVRFILPVHEIGVGGWLGIRQRWILALGFFFAFWFGLYGIVSRTGVTESSFTIKRKLVHAGRELGRFGEVFAIQVRDLVSGLKAFIDAAFLARQAIQRAQTIHRGERSNDRPSDTDRLLEVEKFLTALKQRFENDTKHAEEEKIWSGRVNETLIAVREVLNSSRSQSRIGDVLDKAAEALGDIPEAQKRFQKQIESATDVLRDFTSEAANPSYQSKKRDPKNRATA